MKPYHSFVSILLVSITMFMSFNVIAQSNSSSVPFKITANYENGELYLKCNSGCAWTDLSFTLKDSQNPQFINEMGMTSKKDEQKVNPNLDHFLFSFQKSGTRIKCESMLGTDWDQLDFSCTELSCRAIIDKSGVIVPNKTVPNK